VEVITPKRKVALKPMEQARVDSTGMLIVLRDVPGEEIVSWKNGYFYFGHSSLREVMRQLARWYDVEVDYRAGRIDVDYEELLTRDHSLNYLVKYFNNNNIDCRLEGRKLVVLP
jgi:ferric-dicitrate binding protein FerR (iron transport regulator)